MAKINLKYKNTNLNAIFKENEFGNITSSVQEVCKKEQDVIGVLLTGSFIQNRKLSEIKNQPHLTGSAQEYYDICMSKGRKLSHHPDSDLDVWVCTRDVYENSDTIRNIIDSGAINLLEMMASNPNASAKDFIEQTGKLFTKFYKKEFLYSNEWQRKDNLPWMARPFKQKILEAISGLAPKIKNILKEYFNRNNLDDFVELRAYPISTFNIKPHLVQHKSIPSRNPFPYFIKDLVNLERNCIVLYADQNCSNLPYPFNENGLLLGEIIAKHIDWTKEKEEYTYTKRFTVK